MRIVNPSIPDYTFFDQTNSEVAMRNFMTTLFVTALLALGCQTSEPEKPQGLLGKNPDFAALNVCELLPGDSIAAAVGGRISDVRAFDSGASAAKRCRYTVFPADSSSHTPSVFVVHLQSAADFDTLKILQEDPIEPLHGLGDDAFITYHSNTARYDLYVVKRERYLIEITGDDPAAIHKIAELALARL